MKWALETATAAILVMANPVFSMTSSNRAFDEIQPDGTVVTLKLVGDEYSHRRSDMDGFTAVRDSTGTIVYAVEGPTGELLPTDLVVGKGDPKGKGLKKGARDKAPKDCTKHICREGKGSSKGSKNDNSFVHPGRHLRGDSSSGQNEDQSRRRAVQTTGILKNLVVPIRFQDHKTGGAKARVLPSKADLEILMNHVHDPDSPNSLAPTGSVRDVFLENSYGKLDLQSTVLDWVDIDMDESAVADSESGLSDQIKVAIKAALVKVDALIDFNDFDLNNDNVIDAITILHSGYAAEWGGDDAFGTASDDRIWSHKWSVDWDSTDGVKVDDYHISPALWDVSGTEMGRIGVIAHETGHFLGLPDLYDTDHEEASDAGVDEEDGDGIGSWGLMANSWGFDGEQRYPPHMCAQSKIDMGWLVPKEVEYGINHVSATELQSPTYDQVIKIGDGKHGYPAGEYLLISNRQAIGFDGAIPQGGLAIWHIDTSADYDIQGYPGQAGWPANGKHYRIALLPADGAYHLEKDENEGDNGDLFSETELLPSTDVTTGPFPNTDAYQGGTVVQTTNEILQISASGDDMTFVFTNENDVGTVKPTTIEPTTANPTGTIPPTTIEPTTANPTGTIPPTTIEPTTANPTGTIPPTSFQCKYVGDCESNEDCCSQECQWNIETNTGTCTEEIEYEACVFENGSVDGYCQVNDECCSGDCHYDKKEKVSSCKKPKKVKHYDCEIENGLIEGICAFDDDCCSGECDWSKKEKEFTCKKPKKAVQYDCEIDGGLIEGVCTIDDDCCSGDCHWNKKEDNFMCKKPKKMSSKSQKSKSIK